MGKGKNSPNTRSKSKNKTNMKTSNPTKTKNKKKTKTIQSKVRINESKNFDNTRFVDHNAEKVFNNHFMNKSVVAERVVALDELRHTSIPYVFRGRDWEPLLNPVSPPSKLLVREFYANIHAIDKASSSFTVYVRGNYLRVTPTLIANLYDLHCVPDPTFPYTDDEAPSMDAITTLLFGHPVAYLGEALSTSHFTVENHVLTRIVCTNLFPVKHMTVLTLDRVRFLYALLSGASIDIASHICWYMLEVYRNASANQSLPFPCLVNRLLASSCSIPSIDGEATIDLHGPIGLHSISLSKAQLRKKNSPSAGAEVPSSSQGLSSSQTVENSRSSTPVNPSATPSAALLKEVCTYLVDKANILIERSDFTTSQILQLKNESVAIKSQLQRIQEHLGITIDVPSAAPPDTGAPSAAPPETVAASAAPPDTSAPRRLNPSSSDTAATSETSGSTASETESG